MKVPMQTNRAVIVGTNETVAGFYFFDRELKTHHILTGDFSHSRKGCLSPVGKTIDETTLANSVNTLGEGFYAALDCITGKGGTKVSFTLNNPMTGIAKTSEELEGVLVWDDSEHRLEILINKHPYSSLWYDSVNTTDFKIVEDVFIPSETEENAHQG